MPRPRLDRFSAQQEKRSVAEAVCAMFSPGGLLRGRPPQLNGDLARSLGVNNASCKLLVDHLSSRGSWRGVNRTRLGQRIRR